MFHLRFCLILAIFYITVESFNFHHKNIFHFLLTHPFLRCKCRCGLPNREGRFLGGEYAGGHEFPWLASITVKDILASTGVLINDQYVLSAASPLIGLSPYDVKVTLGQYDTCNSDVSSVNMSVEGLLVHPDFNPTNSAHDLTLLKLSNVLSLERRIRPICLPTLGRQYLGQVATIIGWTGRQSNTGPTEYTCRPRKLGLPVLGPAECIKTVLQAEYFGHDKGCVGVVGGPSHLCKADAGSPVSFKTFKGFYELIGILSDKNECTTESSTSLYTKITDNINWLIHNTKDACYCKKFYL